MMLAWEPDEQKLFLASCVSYLVANYHISHINNVLFPAGDDAAFHVSNDSYIIDS